MAEETLERLFLRRLRIGGGLIVFFVAAYAVVDVVVLDGPIVSRLLALKLVPLLAAGMAAVADRIGFVRRRLVAFSLVGVLGLAMTLFWSSVLEHDAWYVPTLATSLGITVAVFLPWGAAAQTFVSATLFVMVVADMTIVLGPSGVLGPSAISCLWGTAIVLGNAPLVAATIRSLFFRNAEIVAANERLSQVMSRRLSEANGELEKRGLALERALEEAEKANVARSRFLANISHEFRTPLTSILGFAAMLRNGAAGPIGSKQLDYANEICRGAEHLLQIVDNVLTHARIEAQDDPLQLSDVPVDLLIEVACRQVKPSAVEKAITIRRSPPNRAHVLADKQKCLQIMLNLLSNAIKFSPPDGEIGVETRDVGDGVEIVVWDRGIGIADDDLERIFRPFEQVERSNRTSRKGTGLGLTITRRLVEAHGGRIWAESDPSGGSRFIVALPKSPPSAVVADERIVA